MGRGVWSVEERAGGSERGRGKAEGPSSCWSKNADAEELRKSGATGFSN